MENVCLCKKVSKETIVEAVKEATKAGSGCCNGGRCKNSILEIIDENK